MGDMASTATATAVPPPPSTSPRQQLAALESLELSSRADSGHSLLSQGSASGSSEQQQMRGASAELDAAADAGAAATAFAGLAGSQGSGPSGVQGPGGAAAAAAAAASAAAAPPVKKEDARSSALKALAGVSAIVSKSRKVDAEALQAIKSQRAKARAEGLTPGTATPAGGTGRVTPPPGTVASVAAVGAQEGPGISPFASATSQGLARSPSSNNMGSLASGLGHATSLPISMHSMQRTRRSPASTPPASSADYDAMVSKMTITELVALKQAVESQLAKQAMALAQLHASQQQVPATTDMLSQQYAALLLQNAQQAQLVQQLSSQQQAAHAVAIQQALSAAATAAGITSPTFSPEQLLLGQAAQQSVAASTAALGQYASMPLPDMASPFASAAYPPESGFTLPPEAGARGPVGVAAAAGLVTGRNKSGGSPRSASAEQHLIGEALHSFVDPERQGPPSRQGSALVNGINWSDRRASGALPPQPASFARSRSLPHPQDALYPDRSASLSTYLPSDRGEQQLPTIFGGLSMQGEGGGVPMAVPLPRHATHPHGHGTPPIPPPVHGHMSPPGPHSVSFNDNIQTRTFQPGY
ncbi:hypothetical protein C2E21_5567 [Chlorella sorokiniana]|uniref:Uncharacterized protein n=1 Tax=Chlorella sorokiniana TaxID=3076 RepID=A0A2P6TP22_CHLSO|nr:hypothetical protein C2E21_5567 [Chlorella sorokiniana]|eukprot:PRW51091.1 hypothetical protein C2E21_5567 [Chlorella sorokiniana]